MLTFAKICKSFLRIRIARSSPHFIICSFRNYHRIYLDLIDRIGEKFAKICRNFSDDLFCTADSDFIISTFCRKQFQNMSIIFKFILIYSGQNWWILLQKFVKTFWGFCFARSGPDFLIPTFCEKQFQNMEIIFKFISICSGHNWWKILQKFVKTFLGFVLLDQVYTISYARSAPDFLITTFVQSSFRIWKLTSNLFRFVRATIGENFCNNLSKHFENLFHTFSYPLFINNSFKIWKWSSNLFRFVRAIIAENFCKNLSKLF